MVVVIVVEVVKQVGGVPASVVLVPVASQQQPYINSSTCLSSGHGTVYGSPRHYTYCLHCIYILNSGQVAATRALSPPSNPPLFAHVGRRGEQETTRYYDTNDPLCQDINDLKAQGFGQMWVACGRGRQREGSLVSCLLPSFSLNNL